MPDPDQTGWGREGRVLYNRKLQQTRLHATLAFGPRAFESRAWRGCRNGRTLALGCANGDPCSL